MDNDDIADIVGGVAEWFGLGGVVKGALGGVLGGVSSYAQGRSTETGDGVEVPYVYERVLTRRRELNVNDR